MGSLSLVSLLCLVNWTFKPFRVTPTQQTHHLAQPLVVACAFKSERLFLFTRNEPKEWGIMGNLELVTFLWCFLYDGQHYKRVTTTEMRPWVVTSSMRSRSKTFHISHPRLPRPLFPPPPPQFFKQPRVISSSK